jgi:hypothetical protein
MRRQRQRMIEPVFGSLLQHYGLRRVNTLGRSSAHKTMLLTAIAFLKKLLKHQPKKTMRLAIVLPCTSPERQLCCGWRQRQRRQNQLGKKEVTTGSEFCNSHCPFLSPLPRTSRCEPRNPGRAPG